MAPTVASGVYQGGWLGFIVVCAIGLGAALAYRVWIWAKRRM